MTEGSPTHYILQFPNPVRVYKATEKRVKEFMAMPTDEPLTSVAVVNHHSLVDISVDTLARVYCQLTGMTLGTQNPLDIRESVFAAIKNSAEPLGKYTPIKPSERKMTDTVTEEKPKRTMKRGTPDAPLAVRRNSKIGNVFALLEQEGGASSEELLESFGEQLRDTAEATAKRVEGYLLESWIRKEKGYTWSKTADDKYKLDQPVVWTGAAKAKADDEPAEAATSAEDAGDEAAA